MTARRSARERLTNLIEDAHGRISRYVGEQSQDNHRLYVNLRTVARLLREHERELLAAAAERAWVAESSAAGFPPSRENVRAAILRRPR